MSAPLSRLTSADPVTLARGSAAGRIAIGVVLVLAPSVFSRRIAGVEPRQDAAAAARIAGARDLSLGLGTLLAARDGATPELRRWVEASALADGIDSYAFLRSSSFPLLPRFGSLLAALTAAIAGTLVARQLPR